MKLVQASSWFKEDGMLKSRVVLRFNKDNKVTPWVTHLECEDSDGSTHYVWGNYYSEYLQAEQDFFKRCDKYQIGVEVSISV